MKKYILLMLWPVLSLQVVAQDLPSTPDPIQISHTAPDLLSTPPPVSFTPVAKKQQRNIPKWVKTAGIAAGGAGLIYTSYLIADEPVNEFAQTHRSDKTDAVAKVVEPLGRQGNLTPVAAGALVGGLIFRKPKLAEVGVVALGGLYLNGLFSSTLKKQFQRHRPNATTDADVFEGPDGNETNNSLPSSHTSTAFAMATAFASVYNDRPLVPILAYSTATAVGLSRINDNKHWASDVMAGAAIGYLSSKSVHLLYRFTEKKWKNRKSKLLVVPQTNGQMAGVNATLTF